ncbi:uncharacterized protein LOC142233476 [Haematobia irritans]
MKNNPKDKFILNIYDETKRFLRKQKDIIVTRSDKGNKTVIMYKKDYKTGMEELLNDKSTYRTMREDPTLKLQRKNNKIIMDLFKAEYITKQEKFHLTSNSATAPRLYGLPKIHKTNMPLRPISSSVEVPCYNLSKYIGDILSNIILEKYNIKNSMELKTRLEEVSLDEDDILISLDVVSLFTNIPIYLAIKNIMTQWKTLEKHTKIPKTQFLNILQFCLNDNNYFNYNNTIYNQIYGMPMGNPLSPTIADIVLDTLLEQVLNDLEKKNIKIKLITKYVDDLFAIISKKDEEIILKTFNQYHNKLQFTMEKETNNCLPYLDIKVYRNNRTIVTEWYTKSIASGRILNFHSSQPINQKINTATNLLMKAITLSDDKFKNKNINKVKEILQQNAFPQNIIDNITKNSTNNKSDNTNKTTPSGNPKKFYSFSFIPKLTESKKLREIIEDKEISFAYRPNRTIASLFTSTKTKIEKTQQSNVVYEITCIGNNNENCNQCYVGTTKRSLSTRINEHQTDIKKGKQTTALAQHCIERQHTPNWEDVRILDRERRANRRYTLESLRIQQKQHCAINRKEDKDNTNAVYTIALV